MKFKGRIVIRGLPRRDIHLISLRTPNFKEETATSIREIRSHLMVVIDSRLQMDFKIYANMGHLFGDADYAFCVSERKYPRLSAPTVAAIFSVCGDRY